MIFAEGIVDRRRIGNATQSDVHNITEISELVTAADTVSILTQFLKRGQISV